MLLTNYSCKSVSYTHLDVYKRQVQDLQKNVNGRTILMVTNGRGFVTNRMLHRHWQEIIYKIGLFVTAVWGDIRADRKVKLRIHIDQRQYTTQDSGVRFNKQN